MAFRKIPLLTNGTTREKGIKVYTIKYYMFRRDISSDRCSMGGYGARSAAGLTRTTLADKYFLIYLSFFLVIHKKRWIYMYMCLKKKKYILNDIVRFKRAPQKSEERPVMCQRAVDYISMEQSGRFNSFLMVSLYGHSVRLCSCACNIRAGITDFVCDGFGKTTKKS